jgi:hypothetical protein
MFSVDEPLRPDAWQAVIDRFDETDPQSAYHVRLAKKQLALLYMRDDLRRDEARALFEELAAMDETESHFRATGIAGLSALDYFDEQYASAARRIEQLNPLREKLDSDLAEMVYENVFPDVRKQIDKQEADKLDEWIKRKFSPEGVDEG